jgi:hypothetical protein
MSSCQYVGYWTQVNEDWFQKRLQAIRDGKAFPMTATEWKKALRVGAHETVNVVRNNERAAAKFLSRSS